VYEWQRWTCERHKQDENSEGGCVPHTQARIQGELEIALPAGSSKEICASSLKTRCPLCSHNQLSSGPSVNAIDVCVGTYRVVRAQSDDDDQANAAPKVHAPAHDDHAQSDQQDHPHDAKHCERGDEPVAVREHQNERRESKRDCDSLEAVRDDGLAGDQEVPDHAKLYTLRGRVLQIVVVDVPLELLHRYRICARSSSFTFSGSVELNVMNANELRVLKSATSSWALTSDS